MRKTITLNRGLDLRLAGAAEWDEKPIEIAADEIAIVPDDFPGLTPKVAVKPGESVAKGQPLIQEKLFTDISIVSPIAGTVVDVVRGERRKVMRVVVKADGSDRRVDPAKPADEAGQIKLALMKGGVWAQMRQLPFDIVPDPTATPRDIFITTFDSAPLATPLMARVDGQDGNILAGITALLKLTEGTVFIGVRQTEQTASWIGKAAEMDRVCVAEFGGKHPVGLPEVQAAVLAPVNKGETVWLTDVENLARIGSIATTGQCDWTTTVALTGSEVEKPHMIQTTVGAAISPLVKGQLKESGRHQRIISGNVLTGVGVAPDGYLRYPYRQITVIPEGDDVDEFMGWASMSPRKMSENRSFLSKLFGRRNFSPDARINGGRRAMIMSGLYDKVMPMDILPEYLIKAILARDIDRMEALGIYEVTPADFALCEYIDPSKLELQKIVREGLDYLRKELK